MVDRPLATPIGLSVNYYNNMVVNESLSNPSEYHTGWDVPMAKLLYVTINTRFDNEETNGCQWLEVLGWYEACFVVDNRLSKDVGKMWLALLSRIFTIDAFLQSWSEAGPRCFNRIGPTPGHCLTPFLLFQKNVGEGYQPSDVDMGAGFSAMVRA